MSSKIPLRDKIRDVILSINPEPENSQDVNKKKRDRVTFGRF